MGNSESDGGCLVDWKVIRLKGMGWTIEEGHDSAVTAEKLTVVVGGGDERTNYQSDIRWTMCESGIN